MSPAITGAIFLGESQRDSATKPRVARNELPWDHAPGSTTTLKGLWPTGTGSAARPQPRWGCETPAAFTQGSSSLATLGFIAESLWDSFQNQNPSLPSARSRGQKIENAC